MFAANIPDGYLIALVPIFVTAILALLVWIVKELNRVSVQNARNEEAISDHERRISGLESYRTVRSR